MVGYDGPTLAFVEVKTRGSEQSAARSDRPLPEEAVNWEKRRNLLRMARQFLRIRRIDSVPHRFDIVAIDSWAGAHPQIRLHNGAFRGETSGHAQMAWLLLLFLTKYPEALVKRRSRWATQ